MKETLEEEFSGFVDIFVSSDGFTIPAGANFLKRIEDGLLNCDAAIFLISPNSVNRNWINFELGAVWIRKKTNEINNSPEIPAIPFCHSGIELGKLPQPINNLNAIQGNVASQLEFAFRSIQNALGGRGKLKTDFQELATNIIKLERQYTLGTTLKDFFKLFTKDASPAFKLINENPDAKRIILGIGRGSNEGIAALKRYENDLLKGYVNIEVKNAGLLINEHGAFSGGDVDLIINTDILIEHKDSLRNLN